MAHDVITNKPSITLFFPYVAFIISVIAVILLIKENTLYGTIAAIGMWIVALVLYLMRRINKAKLDINDGEIEFEGGDNESEKTT